MRVVIPLEVKLGAHTYKVKMVRALRERRGAVGTSHSEKGYIIVESDQTGSQRVGTFIHELVHQSEAVFGEGNKKLTEGQISAIAEGLTQVFTGAMGLTFDFSKLPEIEAV